MNEAREELRRMRQLEHESVSVYIYKWGRALYRSTGIYPENERHPHVIKDFISSLKKKHQEQNHQQVGRNETATKYCQKSLQTGV